MPCRAARHRAYKQTAATWQPNFRKNKPSSFALPMRQTAQTLPDAIRASASALLQPSGTRRHKPCTPQAAISKFSDPLVRHTSDSAFGAAEPRQPTGRQGSPARQGPDRSHHPPKSIVAPRRPRGKSASLQCSPLPPAARAPKPAPFQPLSAVPHHVPAATGRVLISSRTTLNDNIPKLAQAQITRPHRWPGARLRTASV